MADWDESADFVIIGSGGGSLCAAMAMIDAGLKPLVLEKQSRVGGSTAMSGGVLWIPANPLLARDGISDSLEQAHHYLDAVLGDAPDPGSTPARRDAYLETGPRLIEYLQAKGIPFIRCEGWSDYYDDVDGGLAEGRSLGVELFDLRRLGEWADKFQTGPMVMPLTANEAADASLAMRTLGGLLTVAKLYFRMAKARLSGARICGFGAALQGRMLEAALRQGVDLRCETPVESLLSEDGKVVGVEAQTPGGPRRIRATKGVLINAGGFARNQSLRERYHGFPTDTRWSISNPGDTGEMIEAATGLGAALHGLDRGIWLPGSQAPDRPGPFVHSFDSAKPHCIFVDQDGERFTDESGSYMEIGCRMNARHSAKGEPSTWAIIDSTHRRRYFWGDQPPGKVPDRWLESGFFIRADTIEELAAKTGLPADRLGETVDRFNRFARAGVDPDFGRGARAYDRFLGDPRNKPNASLGEIAAPPFYAIKLFTGDVGTFGGLVTDEHGRVLTADGAVIEGLYATGNSTASVFGGIYPGAGGSIGASFVFGLRAAEHAIGPKA
ncbi:3-oxosteroid 1-dehydrogenase [Sphingomonas sp. YR710]|uniref:FAD-dependent oxidoreductase n=1 Tax=Sphingomonas sp. YR710 TaxID=1882773 RepID=UPI00088D0251|nr:FAD-dependent oxidoreductase [Sphingomonas sp. YR710]SDD60860.1 3-oxosteroid 1-dehydrogenase [Sphingomonas sp. YR710]